MYGLYNGIAPTNISTLWELQIYASTVKIPAPRRITERSGLKHLIILFF
jgi:hypothetical protein